MTTPTLFAIHGLVTAESAEAYHFATDKWLFAHDELDAAGIPSTDANIEVLESALDSFVFPSLNGQWSSNTADQF
jgi:hypothetical protein